MLRITKLVSTLMALLLAVALSGCGGSPSPGSTGEPPAKDQAGTASPGDVALLYLEAMRGNVAGLKEVNPDTELPEDGLFSSYHQGMLEAWGVKTTPEQDAQLTEAMLEGLSKARFEVVDESIDGKQATVKLSIWGLEMSDSLEKQMDAIGGQVTDATEDAAIVEVPDKMWREAPVADEPVQVEVQFRSVSDGRWIIDPSSGTSLFNAYLSYDD